MVKIRIKNLKDSEALINSLMNKGFLIQHCGDFIWAIGGR